jgi:hypothetical protein
MKSIKELRYNLPDRIETCGSRIGMFVGDDVLIDFDVYLPSKGIKLQRGFVWTLEQRRELIWSIFYGRKIPAMALLNRYDGVWQVIDGKQRLSTLIDFWNDKFDIEIEGELYTMSTLPHEYKSEVKRFWFPYTMSYETKENEFSDEFKINWFKYINFAGTPQDKEHLESLKQKLQ